MKDYIVLFRDLIGRLGWRFPMLIVWTALVGLGEGISVLLLLPLLNRMGVVTGGTQGAAIRLLESSLALIGASSSLAILSVIIALTAVQTGMSIGLTWWSVQLTRHYQSQRQLELFAAFMQAKWGFLVDRRAGELMSAIITECDRVGAACTLSLLLLANIVITLVYAILSLLVAWQVTLGLICFAILAALAMIQLYKSSYAVGQSLAPLNTEFQSNLTENFAGAKFIKAVSAVDRATARFELLLRRVEKATVAANSMPATVRNVLEFIAFVGLASIIVINSSWTGVAPAHVVVVIALFGRLFPRVTAMQAQVHHLNWNIPAIRIVTGLKAAAENAAERRDSAAAGQKVRVDLPTFLVVDGLEVKYGERAVLNGLDLRLSMPGLVAVVGGSGAGKSTLVHTLLGLTELSAGSIRLGNNDFVSTPLSAWRRAIGYVPQETILFHTSIRENLTFANPDASEMEVEMAARRAHAHDFIMGLSDGYDTVIGDQGAKLSGGQRQRLGIARALLGNPELIVLDEAMSALDSASELEIMRTLEELRKQVGVLMIAHRLASVCSADVIYVLEDGRVAETGTWDELMAGRGRLYGLAKAQGLHRMAVTAN